MGRLLMKKRKAVSTRLRMKYRIVATGIREISDNRGNIFYEADFSAGGKAYKKRFCGTETGNVVDPEAKQKAIRFRERLQNLEKEKADLDFDYSHIQQNILVGGSAYSVFHRKQDEVKEIYWYDWNGKKYSVADIQEAEPFQTIMIRFRNLGPVGLSQVKGV